MRNLTLDPSSSSLWNRCFPESCTFLCVHTSYTLMRVGSCHGIAPWKARKGPGLAQRERVACFLEVLLEEGTGVREGAQQDHPTCSDRLSSEPSIENKIDENRRVGGYSSSGPSINSAAGVVPVAPYSACEIAWPRWGWFTSVVLILRGTIVNTW